MKKKLFSLLMMVAMVLTALLPFSKTAFADANDGITTLNVHKILVNTLPNSNVDYNPAEGITDLNKNFGTDAKYLEGVYFLAVDVTDQASSQLLFGKDVPPEATATNEYSPQPTANNKVIEDYVKDKNAGGKYIFGGKTSTATTTGNIALKLPKGTYMIYEVKSLSTPVFEKDSDKKLLEKSKAVPVKISVPYVGTSGNEYNIHIYPKNTATEGPVIDKTVTDLEKVGDGVDVGGIATWYLQVTIPEDIKDYKVLKLTDTFNDGLEFISAKAYITDATAKDTNDATEVPTGEYTPSYVGSEKKLTVNFVKENNGTYTISPTVAANAGKKLVVEVKTRVTEDAKQVLKDKNGVIKNKYTLNYGHNPGDEKNKDSKEVEVYTGGAKFVKVDAKDDKKVLAKAEFLVKNNKGAFLVEKAGTPVETKWVKESDIDFNDLGKDLGDGFKVKVLKSGEDGTFVIEGLAYGEAGESYSKPPTARQYTLYEVKAPEGYALPTDRNVLTFTIDSNSYKTTTAVGAALKVLNNKQDIPQTGGIGTVVFTAVGLLLMVTSFVALRRRASHSK